MIEERFDVSFVADLALREKQIQQNYRPIIAVHKWFARRPGTLFRSLLLSEFAEQPLREAYFRDHQLTGISVADPFMGGGTPLLESNRLGCDVYGYDINPMSYWIVRQEIEHLDLASYRRAADRLRANLESQIGHLYRTRCLKCGSPDAYVKYFLWVKTLGCKACGHDLDLFPGYLIAEDVRHPMNVLVCPSCGELNERRDRKTPGPCSHCQAALSLKGPAARSGCRCERCKTVHKYPDPARGAPAHRMFAIEYYCPSCKPSHKGRFFKKPDADDVRRYADAEAALGGVATRFVPDETIPSGDETNRLHRWGYRFYREMFNSRQLFGLEQSCRLIVAEKDERVRHALSTNLSDLLRYQNMLCRYDTMALKSLDIFSVHGFPVGLIQCESNLLGIPGESVGTSVGSGGWCNIADKFEKAKAYCDEPFEVRHVAGRKVKVWLSGEWIGDRRNGNGSPEQRRVEIRCGDAKLAELPPHSLDAVLTDPPYYGSVQYAELMDFCYVWLRRVVPSGDEAFKAVTTRHTGELTENDDMDRGIETFARGLSAVFARMAEALKPNAPLVFTYHHNKLEAYIPVAIAILDSGLTCSAAVPCPAEMEASIHINGTGSSIVDTVFVCRKTLVPASQPVAHTPDELASIVTADVQSLREAGFETSAGDVRCLIHGHLTRNTVARLRDRWDKSRLITAKVVGVTHSLNSIGMNAVLAHLKRVSEAPERVEDGCLPF